ncbi:MAG: 4-hydroxy-tetrahydrodipicolinate reductase [Synergistaceae bacterium]|jgi:4-hydroxy-tetrahydrodipicolinate reductase|nr:4-hydroxy-tetrahydrodipicolinate reductase [Synergistaceae bacterium]
MKYGIVGYSGRMGQEIAKLFGDAGHDLVLTSDIAGTEYREKPEVVMDFSSHAALAGTVELCGVHGAALVVGTTALSGEHLASLRRLGEKHAVVQSFNFATGVNVLKMILRDYAPLLSDWDMEIEETHHNKKKDAPSGTAILLMEATGRDAPATHSLRLGGVPGDHSVHFANDGEVLSFTHRALARNVFALGALRAALFALSARPGFYSFEDVLRQGRK